MNDKITVPRPDFPLNVNNMIFEKPSGVPAILTFMKTVFLNDSTECYLTDRRYLQCKLISNTNYLAYN